jgi:hypothetical protein
MEDLLPVLLHIQHLDASQSAQVAGLTAALGIKSGGIQDDCIATLGFPAIHYPGGEVILMAVFII